MLQKPRAFLTAQSTNSMKRTFLCVYNRDFCRIYIALNLFLSVLSMIIGRSTSFLLMKRFSVLCLQSPTNL